MQTVLVVDDSCTVRTKIQRILRQAEYHVLLANDGEQALAMLEQKPDLMILDIVMPGMDGYDVLEKMKQMEHCRVPVLFLTILDNQALRLLGQEFGGYLQKPVAEEDLLATVDEVLTPAGPQNSQGI